MGAGATADGSRNGGADLSARLRAALEAVLACDRDSVARLKYARTSITFCVEDFPGGVTLLLDRSPPQIAYDESAEVEVRLTQEQAERFICGTFHMPSALESGAVTATGPLRKYLEVDPILRGVLRDISGADEDSGAHSEPWDGHGPGLDPQLAAIETRDLHKSFGPAKVLQGVDLQIPEGVVGIILGPSGTGKSVLLSHVIEQVSKAAYELVQSGLFGEVVKLGSRRYPKPGLANSSVTDADVTRGPKEYYDKGGRYPRVKAEC